MPEGSYDGNYIPEDDFAHTPDLTCGCHPYVAGLPGLWMGGIVHRAVRAEPLPDTLPESWNLNEEDE